MDLALLIASEAASMLVKTRCRWGLAWIGEQLAADISPSRRGLLCSNRYRSEGQARVDLFASAMVQIFKDRPQNRAL